MIKNSVIWNITSGFLRNALQSPLAWKRGAWHHCWPAACLGGDCLWLQTPPCLPLLCLLSHLQWRQLLRAWPGNLRDADTVEITTVVRAQEAKHKTPCDNAFLAGSDQHGPNHIPLGYLLETGVHITLYHHALPRSCCSHASSQA